MRKTTFLPLFALARGQKVGAPLFDGPFMKDGVFQSYSHDLAPEVDALADLMGLRPGLSYCEMGGANGLFLVALGKRVMPSGRLYATAPKQEEIDAMRSATAAENLGEVTTLGLATDAELGLPAQACDVIFSRMVYHMIPTPRAYLPQLLAALKPGGRMLILDHDPDNGVSTTRFNATLKGMGVVPKEVEINEFTGAGFALLRIVNAWRWFGEDENGYGLLWGHATAANAAPANAAHHMGAHSEGAAAGAAPAASAGHKMDMPAGHKMDIHKMDMDMDMDMPMEHDMGGMGMGGGGDCNAVGSAVLWTAVGAVLAVGVQRATRRPTTPPI